MSLALLFPGQGVQHAGMLPWLDHAPAAEPLLARLAAAIGPDWRARLADADWAETNRVAQCLMTATSLAAWQVLTGLGLPAAMAVAGYSVGELASFCAAGVFDAPTALSLAEARAAAMDHAAAGRQGGLIAVAGASDVAIDAACAGGPVSIAIRLAPDRCLLGGDDAALIAATGLLLARGAEVTRLRIRIASHTPQMQAAADAFAVLVEPMPWQAPGCVLVSDASGAAVRRVVETKQALARQLATTVQWARCMETLAERRPRCVLEVGAGTSLASLWRVAQPSIPVRSVDEFDRPEGVVAWVDGVLRGRT